MLTQSTTDRFWPKVDRSGGPDACWLWTAHRRDGYGQFRLDGRHQTAHRIAYELDRGHPPPPERPLVLHHCDNRPCCNARHLFSGTQTDNMRDAMAKGRKATGECNGLAKLTETQVREIRRRYGAGETQRPLAREFGVGQTTVGSVVRLETWAHVA